jgi:hypothetical protein
VYCILLESLPSPCYPFPFLFCRSNTTTSSLPHYVNLSLKSNTQKAVLALGGFSKLGFARQAFPVVPFAFWEEPILIIWIPNEREREREGERGGLEKGNEEEDILVRKRLKTVRPYVLLSFYTKATSPSIYIVLFKKNNY